MTGRNVVPFSAPGQSEAVEPPHNTQAERALLGALLIDNEVMGAVAAVVEAEHFFWADHQEVYACIAALIASGRPATAITVKGYLKQPEIGGVPAMHFLAAIAGEATTTVNAAGYAAVVRDFAARRRLMRTGAELLARAQGDSADVSAQDLIEAVETDLLAVRAEVPQTHLAGMTAGEGGLWLIDRIQQLRSGLLQSTAVSTGIQDLDRATSGGFGRGQLWLMAGRPGMGKTVVMSSLSRRAAKHAGVLVFQLEVTRDQQFARYLADLSYVANSPLTFGQIMEGTGLTEEDLWRLGDAQKRLANLHLKVECEPSITLAQIVFAVKAEKKRLAKQGVQLGVVFLDYLKFIKAGDRYKGNRVLEIGEISGALKALAKAEDICIVLLAQLNRGVEAQGREDKRPTMADLRDSGELEQDADVVVLLYRDAYYLQKSLKAKNDPEMIDRLIERQNALELILGKNRAGPTPTLDLWCDVAASSIAQHARGQV
jgi:replicative DNA helicase